MKTRNVSSVVLDRVNAALTALDSDELVVNSEATFASMLLKSLFGDLLETGKLADSIPSTEKVWEEFSSAYYTGRDCEDAYNEAIAAVNSGLNTSYSVNIEDSVNTISSIKAVAANADRNSKAESAYVSLVNVVSNGIGQTLSSDVAKAGEVKEKVVTFFNGNHIKLYKSAYESLVDLLSKETGCSTYDYNPKKVVTLYGNVSDWFVKNHNALRAVKPAAETTYTKASGSILNWRTEAEVLAEQKAKEEAKKKPEVEAGEEEAEGKKTSKKAKGTHKAKGNGKSKKAKDIDQSKVDALPNNEKVAVVETWLHNVANEIGYNPARQYVAAKYKVKGQGYTAIATKLVDKVNITELVKDKDYMKN